MLYVFFGSDTIKVREAAYKHVESYAGEDVAQTTIATPDYELGQLTDLAGATSLFGGKEVVVIDTPSQKKEVYEEVVGMLEALGASENVFVVIEDTLLAAEKKKFLKYATESNEYTKEKGERFNTFAITDAFLNKDKKSLWMLLMEARREGLAEEEVIGVLYWQVKMLRLAAQTGSVGEAGLKPFVYNKAKRGLAKFDSGELATISTELLAIYHDSHLGKRDAAIALERWALTL